MPRTKKKTARKTTRKTKARKPAKKTAKRATARKTAKKATTRRTAKKTTATRKVTKTALKVGRSPFKKTQIFEYIAGTTELTKKEVAAVFEAFGDVMQAHLKGPGEFTVPGLMKCVVKRKPATKARMGVNPFTGETMKFKAKPARNIVKVRPLKKMKEMVGRA